MGKPPLTISDRMSAIKNAPQLELNIPKPKKRPAFPLRQHRERVFRSAKIFVSRAQGFPCIIRDISASGARVSLEGAVALPDMVVLKLDFGGAAKRARVVWQEKHEAGIEFLASPSNARSQNPK